MSNSNSDLEFYHGRRNSHQQRDGYAHFHQKHMQKSISYAGTFLNDNYHGFCNYTQTIDEESDQNWMYEGRIYVNTFQGYGTLTQGPCEDGEVYQGLFKDNKRFGPGVVTNRDGTQDVGFWNARSLLRLAEEVNQGQITKLARSKEGYDVIQNNRKIIAFPKLEDENDRCAIENVCIKNINSVFFNKTVYDSYRYSPKKSATETNRNNEEKSLLNLKYHILNQQLFQIMNVVYIQYFENDATNCSTNYLALNNTPYMVSALENIIQFRDDEYRVQYSTSRILQNKRNLFNSPGVYETSCKLFLKLCSSGKDIDIENLCFAQKINPDVCDNQGNSGMMFAAAKDKIYVIKRLVNLGGNLNMINDEGINPLNLCLLRYLSLKDGIIDWEAAFLRSPYSEIIYDSPGVTNVIPESLEAESLGGKNCEHSTKTMQYFGEIDCNAINGQLQDPTATDSDKRNDELIENQILQSLKDTLPTSVDEHFIRFKMNTRDSEYQNFQDSEPQANLKKDSSQQYLFDWSFKAKQISNVKKTSKKSKTKFTPDKTTNSTKIKFQEHKLIVITGTIDVLLRLGADPNNCSLPMPSIILSLYCNTSEVLKMLLLSNAVTNHSYTRDNLTLLHILCSMPPAEKLHKMAKLLLRTEINPLQRCAPHHWEAELPKIQGIVERKSENSQQSEICNLGKTPLHLLAFRLDYEQDPHGFLSELGKTIGKGCPESFKEIYMGHTPLSLAVLRGNISLVHSLLEAGADPNFPLEEGLGNCMTLYGLRRFSKGFGFPIARCKKILDTLVLHGGNPLKKIEQNENALEFIIKDNFIRNGSEVRSSINKSAKISSTNSGMDKDKTPKSRKSSKNLQRSDDLFTQIYEYILKLSQDIILSHHHGKIAIFLIKNILQGNDLTQYKNFWQFFNEEDAVRVIAIFAHAKLLDLNKDPHYFLALLFLQYVKKFSKLPEPSETTPKAEATKIVIGKTSSKKLSIAKGKKKNTFDKLVKSKKKSHEIEPMARPSITVSIQSKTNEAFFDEFPAIDTKDEQYLNQQILNTIQRHETDVADIIEVTHFELDPDIKKYRVCFNCGLRKGLKLQCCPACGLIYFCSLKCNVENIAKKTKHSCNSIFYEENRNSFDGKLNKSVRISKSLTSITATPNLMKRNKKDYLRVVSINNLKRTTMKNVFKNLEIEIPSASQIKKTQMLSNLKSGIERSEVGRYIRIADIGSSLQDISEVKKSLSRVFPSSYNLENKHVVHTSTSILTTNQPSVESIDNYVRIDAHADVPSKNYKFNAIYVSSSDIKNLFQRISQTKNDVDTVQHMELCLSNEARSMESVKRVSHLTAVNPKTKMKVSTKKRSKNTSILRNEPIKVNVKQSVSMTSSTNKMKKFVANVAKTTETAPSFQTKPNVNMMFVHTLGKLFPQFDFSTAIAPFVAYSDTQFYYKFSDERPEYLSTHM